MIRNFTIATFAGLMVQHASAATSVGLELSLLVDVSSSVDNGEWLLQRNGYVAAFNDPGIQSLVTNLTNGLAVNYVQWSSSATLSVGWMHLQTAADCTAFANLIFSALRPSSGTVGTQTGVGNAINFGTNSINTNLFDGVRQVIDVSGDGESNTGLNTAAERNAALAAGIDRINGLPIGGVSLQTWYQNNVQGGTNSFTLPVDSFDDFAPAITRKLGAEITNTSVPEGGPGLIGFALTLAGLAGLRYKKALSAKLA